MLSSTRSVLLILFIFKTFFPNAATQADSLSSLPGMHLKEIRINGNGSHQKDQEKGFQVSSVSLEKNYNNATTLLQSLKQTAGLRIREQGGIGSDFQLNLNGFSGNQVKIFLDGMPLENAGGANGLNSLPVGMAERIEIYQGVLPVQLGSDALGGGINIVTRQQSNYLDLSLTGGSFNTRMFSVNGAATFKKSTFIRSSLFLNSSDNDYSVLAPSKNLITLEKDAPAWHRRFHDGFAAKGLTVEAGVKNKSWADLLLIGYTLSQRNKEIQTGETMDVVYGAMQTEARAGNASLRYRKANLWNRVNLLFQAAHNRSVFQLTDTSSVVYNWKGEHIPDPGSDGSAGGERSRTRNRNNEHESLTNLTLTIPLAAKNTLLINHRYSDFYRKSSDPENPGAPASRFPSFFTKSILGVDYSLIPAESLRISAFGKMYNMRSTGYHTVDAFTQNERIEKLVSQYAFPGYGSVLRWGFSERLSFSASYEHTVRLPDAYELYGDGVFVTYAAGLKPESSNNANAEFSATFLKNKNNTLAGKLQLIYRMSKDYIRLNQSVSGGNRTMENKGRVRTMGVSGTLTYTNAFAELTGFATYQDITDQLAYENASGMTGGRTKNITYGYRLPNIPFLFGGTTAGFFRKTGRGLIRLDYEMNAVHEFYLVYSELGLSSYNRSYIIPAQWAHDLRLSWNPGGKHRLGLSCTNLTNALLYDTYRMQKPGRSLNITYRYLLTFKQ